MTKRHQIWFDKLAKDREESATMLEKPSMRGIKNSVVEKYSDQAQKSLFDDEKYIEKNSYASGHENVNIFGDSEMRYFIKTSNTAIDIQLGQSTASRMQNLY